VARIAAKLSVEHALQELMPAINVRRCIAATPCLWRACSVPLARFASCCAVFDPRVRRTRDPRLTLA
jgi:hypothetical protein